MIRNKFKIVLLISSILGVMLVSASSIYIVAAQTIPDNIIAVSPNGKGYLAEISDGKYKMHLEGSGYEMGFQQGYLDPISVSNLANEDWMIQVIYDLMGQDWTMIHLVLLLVLSYNRLCDVIPEDVIPHRGRSGSLQQYCSWFYHSTDTLLDRGMALCRALVEYNTQYAPQEFLDECRGIADGATAAGYPVSYEDVLLLNMGMDALLGLCYPVVVDLLPLMDIFSFLSCSGYVAQGLSTSGENTIMGRHWQFTTYVLSDEMLVMEYAPDSGHNFVSITCPGFVGVTSAMSDQGIGVAQDMVPTKDCDPARYGMGCLFTARYIAQYADQLSDAIGILNNNRHGVSWLYGVGDGRNGETGGMVLETSNSYVRVRTMNYFTDESNYNVIENKNDLITYTNHYLYYDMIGDTDSYSVADSLDRYEWLTNEALDVYGSINLDIGSNLIDYLHPPNHDYYSVGSDVGASVTCWDLTNLKGKSLFGNYNDEWVSISF